MRFPRPIDSALHGFTDYTVGTLLMAAFPRADGKAAGAAHVGYSLFTDYELGAVKVIPYKVHLALDALGAAALAARPFVTGRYKKGRREWLPHVGVALFELTSLLMSDPTGRGNYHGDVDAVREANTEDPLRKIHDGGPAAVPASAA